MLTHMIERLVEDAHKTWLETGFLVYTRAVSKFAAQWQSLMRCISCWAAYSCWELPACAGMTLINEVLHFAACAYFIPLLTAWKPDAESFFAFGIVPPSVPSFRPEGGSDIRSEVHSEEGSTALSSDTQVVVSKEEVDNAVDPFSEWTSGTSRHKLGLDCATALKFHIHTIPESQPPQGHKREYSQYPRGLCWY